MPLIRPVKLNELIVPGDLKTSKVHHPVQEVARPPPPRPGSGRHAFVLRRRPASAAAVDLSMSPLALRSPIDKAARLALGPAGGARNAVLQKRRQSFLDQQNQQKAPQPVSQLLRPPAPAPARASALAARINNQPHLQRPLTDPLVAFAPNPGTYRPEPRKPPPLPARRYRVPSSARELMTARELQTRARLMPGSMPRDRLVELAMRVR